jgi:succinate dehydrogenase / fumarate reductase flavoprotein subunit
MWEHCGVVRNEERLQRGLQKLFDLKDAAANVDVRPSVEGYKDLALALDLRGSLMAAEATIRSAMERRESRGAHQRDDYLEESNPDLKVNFVVKLDENGDQLVHTRDVPPVPDALRPWVEDQEELAVEGRLLE